MEKIIVNRDKGKPDWTLSKFRADDNSFSGVGIEDEKRDVKVFGETRIDGGIYNMDMTYSPKFSKHYYRDNDGNLLDAKTWNVSGPDIKKKFHTPHEVILVLNVKGFTGIRWHWGNSDEDTLGCYIVGTAFGTKNGQEIVTGSRKKYEQIYPIIFRANVLAKKAGKKLQIEYIDND